MAPGAGTGPATGAAAAPRSAQLRADWRQHCLALVEGGSGVIASGFAVADEDALAAAETELERAGFTVSRGGAAAARDRRVRSFIGFADPFGNQIELVSQQEMITRPVAFSRPAGITEFGHLCLDAPDVHEACTTSSPSSAATVPACAT
jgi:2,3-dihydroxy-p-cumate/2,3-dihydroxybenzoate 3,4-dioxygenase